MREKNWGPDELNSVHRETVKKLEPVLSEPSITFTQAKESSVIVNAYLELNLDDFINDTIYVGLCEKDNWFKLA